MNTKLLLIFRPGALDGECSRWCPVGGPLPLFKVTFKPHKKNTEKKSPKIWLKCDGLSQAYSSGTIYAIFVGRMPRSSAQALHGITSYRFGVVLFGFRRIKVDVRLWRVVLTQQPKCRMQHWYNEAQRIEGRCIWSENLIALFSMFPTAHNKKTMKQNQKQPAKNPWTRYTSRRCRARRRSQRCRLA